MKLLDVKHKIDAYFNSVSAVEIVEQFEALGYQFDDADYHPVFDSEINKINVSFIKDSFVTNSYSLVQENITESCFTTIDLTSFEQEAPFTANATANIAYAIAA